MNYFQLKSFGFLTPDLQLFAIVLLFIFMTLYRYTTRAKINKSENQFAVHFAHMFAPVYEEILFRGLLFGGLLTIYPMIKALIISSLIFGIWHLKNIFVMSPKRVLYQILYAGIIFGPITSLVILYTQSIWIGVIIHYINNLWSHIQWDIYKKTGLGKVTRPVRGYIKG